MSTAMRRPGFTARSEARRPNARARPGGARVVCTAVLQQTAVVLSPTRQAGPQDSPTPSYAAIDVQPLNKIVMALFRRKMVAAVGSDSPLSGYDAIIDLTRRLNNKFRTAAETQEATRSILIALFPSWLPGAFKVMFARPLPELSCRMNALATALTCQWLMGPCKVNDDSPTPSYAAIDVQPLNKIVMALFRRKMVAAVGSDSPLSGYDAIIDLTRRLNNKFRTAAETQEATRSILIALFPSWLPGAFKVMFARPLPELSCRMNALATALTCQWLMGPCKVNDVETDDGTVGEGHGVLVERCRYLEQAGCAAVCINSCKVPTQSFFAKDMGLALTMTPNYDDFSCQFAFGKTPLPVSADEAYTTSCFAQCPSKKARRNQQSSCGGIEAPV
ncbi:hypothetical protein TSOC_000599 [Tetrabaena socialis]|uniref:Beta-carotene isomerase D27-like C-terminal domain-containing protein n=1 Tax=Tetrabaena socialis TaxID=47790 RepID=A0A2J8AIV6_9CHLO|nr:hypothetical protein TSOC_000599 [Tetrabaena socialis]|eukprot:PNH12456.1 hypothetical protein TSOC_000599 [Tetrabaena socialis]